MRSTNPARTGRARRRDRARRRRDVRRRRARRARRAGRVEDACPPPARGRVIANVGRLVEANKEALAQLVTQRDRQAVPRGARRGPGDRRHVRLLPRRGPAAVRPDGAVGDARQAAVHLPRAGRRGGDHHRGQLPGRRAVLVPRPGDPVRQRRRLEAGRVRGGVRRRAGAALPRRRRARRRAQPRAGRRARTRSPGSSRRWTRGSSTRSASPARARSAPRSARCAGATCSRRASSSAARTRWS